MYYRPPALLQPTISSALGKLHGDPSAALSSGWLLLQEQQHGTEQHNVEPQAGRH